MKISTLIIHQPILAMIRGSDMTSLPQIMRSNMCHLNQMSLSQPTLWSSPKIFII